MKTLVDANSQLTALLEKPSVDWVREKARQLLKEPGDEPVVLVAQMLVQFAKGVLDAEPGNPILREWHMLVLDARAAISDRSPDQAALLGRFADLLAKTIQLAERNPRDQLISRPSTRRVLLALQTLGGEAHYNEVRELAEIGQTHFSNVVRILRAAELAESRLDEENARERILSLTAKGHKTIMADPRRASGELPKVQPARADTHAQYRSSVSIAPRKEKA